MHLLSVVYLNITQILHLNYLLENVCVGYSFVFSFSLLTAEQHLGLVCHQDVDGSNKHCFFLYDSF